MDKVVQGSITELTFDIGECSISTVCNSSRCRLCDNICIILQLLLWVLAESSVNLSLNVLSTLCLCFWLFCPSCHASGATPGDVCAPIAPIARKWFAGLRAVAMFPLCVLVLDEAPAISSLLLRLHKTTATVTTLWQGNK